jgi:excisionase family DNA binding protein
MVGLRTDRLSVEAAAAAAGVSVDTIRRAYRSGALRAFRPGGTRRIVILRDDLQAWAFADEHLVARGPGVQPRPAANMPVVMTRRVVRQHSARDGAAGSVERLREIERSG